MDQTGQLSSRSTSASIPASFREAWSYQAQEKVEDKGKASYAAASSVVPHQTHLSASGPRFSLGPRPLPSVPYVPSAQSDRLLKLINDKPGTLIEIVSPPGVGKTTLLQYLIDPRDDRFASYALLGRIDCSTVSRAHADIQAINQALGHGSLKPQAALRQVANDIQKNPRSLLVLDGVRSSNVDLVLAWLKPSFGSAQLIYTTTQSLADRMSEHLERPVESLSLGLFTPDEAKQLVQQCLRREPKESLEACDFAQVIKMTGGFPEVIQALCQHYQSKRVMFKHFAEFLAQPESYQNTCDTSLQKIVQASLESLETEAEESPIAARALNLIKQAAWLGDQPIPYKKLFIEEPQGDERAIQMLYDKELVILNIDLENGTLKLNSIFQRVVQKRYESEQHDLLKKNIQSLSGVFSYLTNNEGVNGRQCEPKDLIPYTDLVHTLLLDTCKKESFADEVALLNQVLALGSSLARIYYLYHGELWLAYDCLQSTKHFVMQGLSEERIAQFAQKPEELTAQPIEPQEAALLRLYAQEYLYQAATIGSQLVERGQVPVEVMQNFEKSYAIQVNLGEAADPESIAYTLRNYTRALRKQGYLLNTLEEYKKLRQLLDQYPKVFDERVRAELLVDEGIVQKEAEDRRPQDERDYQAAIDTLSKTHNIYLKHETSNKHQVLGMLSIYLGEAYLAVGKFEQGITHTCQILHYDGKSKGRQARAYFNLARAFDESGYGALAKLFIDQAAPLQLKAYHSTTEALHLNIEKKLLQRHQQATSAQTNTRTAHWKTLEELTRYCETELVAGSAPSNILSRAQIQAFEDKAYHWLRQHYSKADLEAKQAKLAEEETELDAYEKAEAEKLEVQRKQDELWYRELAQRIKLDLSENPRAYLFAEQFKERLRNEIVQQLRHAYGEAMPMSKADLATGLILAFSGLFPQIQVNATAEVTATIDLATIVQGVTKTLSERQRSQQEAGAQRVAGAFEEHKQKAKSLQVVERIEEQIEEMANYAARCWQPVLSAQDWSPTDIQTLAEYGACRLMEYLKTGKVDKLSYQEQVVFALMTGETNKRLTQPKMTESGRSKGKWSVQDFFTKPGIKVEKKKEERQLYLLRGKAYPSIYGYRFGSPIEVRDLLRYTGPFTDEAKAQQEAKSARERGRCTVM